MFPSVLLNQYSAASHDLKVDTDNFSVIITYVTIKLKMDKIPHLIKIVIQ